MQWKWYTTGACCRVKLQRRNKAGCWLLVCLSQRPKVLSPSPILPSLLWFLRFPSSLSHPSFTDLSPALIQSYSLETQVCIAAINSPNSVTLSGDANAIIYIRTMLLGRDKYGQQLRVEAAFHSHHMDYIFHIGQVTNKITNYYYFWYFFAIKDQFLKRLNDSDISPQKPVIPLYSTVTGKIITRYICFSSYSIVIF